MLCLLKSLKSKLSQKARNKIFSAVGWVVLEDIPLNTIGD